MVKQTLSEIGAGDKTLITVFNKSDLLPEPARTEDPGAPPTEAGAWIARQNEPAVYISARNKTGTDLLKNILLEAVRDIYRKRYPHKTRYDDLD